MSSKDALAVSSFENPDPYVMGDGNVHVHTCPVGPHEWHCDSCYCNTMRIRCPQHGGPTPKLNSSR
jgi:hypothetical protein